MEEFNKANTVVENVYWRDKEKETIKEYVWVNWEQGKSGLLYVCGHPGTGKTSIVKLIIKEFEEEKKGDMPLKIFNYNGMAFKNLFEFAK